LNTISSYNPDEQKWANYVPIRKSASTSKNNLSHRTTYGNDIESEFKKAIEYNSELSNTYVLAQLRSKISRRSANPFHSPF